MQIVCYLSFGLKKDNIAYLQLDHATIPAQTKTHIQNFIKAYTDNWMIFGDPFLSDIFKLKSSDWNAEESTLIVTITIDTKKVPADAIPYPRLPPTSLALSILNKFLYTNLMPATEEFYYAYLKNHHIRKTAFTPVVRGVYLSI